MRVSLIALLACLAIGLATAASAQTTNERGASILIFPKVVADSSGDTVLQVANLLESRVDVFCTYVDGASWEATSFSLALIAEQPIQWSAARGRTAAGGEDTNDIPAAPANFAGELICVEVDGTGAPSGGNRLVGRATVTALANGDAFAYAAVGLPSSGFNDGDDTLCLGGEVSDLCFIGAEYNSCPDTWWLSHPAEGAPDEQLGDGATQHTRLAFVPCSQNVRDGTPSSVTVEIEAHNEFEQAFTASVAVSCWADLALTDIDQVFGVNVIGSPAVQTRLRPSAASGGFIVVGERERRAANGDVLSRDALVPQQEGTAALSDAIVLPMGRQ